MKKSILYIASLMIAAVGFTACDDDKAMPPIPVPGADQDIPAANTTILELKEAYYDADPNTGFSYASEVGEKTDGSHYIIRGRVVSSDETGNIYKTLMIEDETAGLTIGIDQSKLYQVYKVGQYVTIDATGLYMGGYGKCMQLGGAPTSAQPSRLEEEVFTEHSWVSGLPEAVAPYVTTVEVVNAAINVPAEFLMWQSRLVKFENMEFETPGEPLAVQGSSTSRYAVDEQGNRLQLYNSGYSTIWDYTLPYGKGSITGILSFYNREWQLLLIDTEAFQGFDAGGTPIEGIFSESFSNTLGEFTAENIHLGSGLTYVWKATASYGATASGFVSGACVESDSRLVSPEIDLTDFTTASASFEQACNKFNSLEGAQSMAVFEVKVAGGEWEALTIPNFTEYASWTFKPTGSIDLSAYAGKKIQIAFHYTSTSAEAGTWEVKNLKITGTK